MNRLGVVALCSVVMVGVAAQTQALVIVNAGTSGFYNDKIGRVLDGTSPVFPLADVAGGDPSLDVTVAPNLAPAAAALGAWLTNPSALNSNWAFQPIPATWAINSETAIVYAITGDYTDVKLSVGIDNGVFVWLNGSFLGGQLRPGGASPGEFTRSLGDLSGTNYIQILREDHGGGTGYLIEATGTPGTPREVELEPVPEPTTLALLGFGLLALARRRRA